MEAVSGPSASMTWPLVMLTSSQTPGHASVAKFQRDLINRLLTKTLQTRALLLGNLVTFHLLGQTPILMVQSLEGRPATRDLVTMDSLAEQLVIVGPSSPPRLIYLQDPTPDMAQGPVCGQGHLEAVTVDGLLGTVRNAIEEVGGSSKEAAMKAAERAVLAGHRVLAMEAPHVGGVSSLLATLHQLVTLPLKKPELYTRYHLRPPRGVLLYGPPGSGKTLLACAAARVADARLLVVNGPDVMSEYYGESEAGLQGVFAAARALAPSVIFIDEIDALAPSRQGSGYAQSGGGSDTSSRVVTTLLTLMDGVSGAQGDSGAVPGQRDRVVVLAATNRPDALDRALRRPGRFEREVEVGVPTPSARFEILTARLSSMRHSLAPEDMQELATSTHGFVAADLSALCNEAAMAALRRRVKTGKAGGGHLSAGLALPAGAGDLKVTMDDFRAAEVVVRPSALREVASDIPPVRWEDVGGLKTVKAHLKEVIEWPLKHADRLKTLGAKAPRGVLLYGPPGCSKTLLARAVAHEAKMNFISIKGGELFSQYVGESEKAVANIFAHARTSAPCILFFDELDGLAGPRDTDGGSAVGERVLSQMLVEMDGLQRPLGVVVLAATNRPDLIDSALLRPGRFDRLLYVPPPDAQSREEIFQVLLRKTQLEADVNLVEASRVTEGYTGADISAICREAALAALEEDINIQAVGQRHLLQACCLVKPSAPPGAFLMSVYEQFRRPGSALYM